MSEEWGFPVVTELAEVFLQSVFIALLALLILVIVFVIVIVLIIYRIRKRAHKSIAKRAIKPGKSRKKN